MYLKHLLPQFFNGIQSNLLTECIQDIFLKDCTSKHAGPIVGYKGFYGILALNTIFYTNIDGILCYCWLYITQRYHQLDINITYECVTELSIIVYIL